MNKVTGLKVKVTEKDLNRNLHRYFVLCKLTQILCTVRPRNGFKGQSHRNYFRERHKGREGTGGKGMRRDGRDREGREKEGTAGKGREGKGNMPA